MSGRARRIGAVAAVDLGATSGRVMIGYLGDGGIRLVPTARFPNRPLRTPEGLRWDIHELYRSLSDGLAAAFRAEPGVCSVGVDSWAIDYALIRDGRMLGLPFAYRDQRTARVPQRVHEGVPFEELYRRNGLQFLSFTTLYQLAADQAAGRLEQAETMLMIPDLVNYWLTGQTRAEVTNASTSGLLDVRTRQWDLELVEMLGFAPGMLPGLVAPGADIGGLLPDVGRVLGSPGPVSVTAVGSHDTASAVVAVPATLEDFAYISSGTWSLVGVELEEPVISEESRLAGFTNEGGVDGRIRFLRNVSGLWLLSESIRQWEREDPGSAELSGLLGEAARRGSPPAVFDVSDPVFVPPGDMPARISGWYRARGMPAPSTKPELVRAILESLASAYAGTVEDLLRLTGRSVEVIHVVGGGSQNALLCQLTADRTGRPVVAGPAEATALGNVLVQARAKGLVPGSLEALRALVAATAATVTYLPRASAPNLL